MDFNSLSLIKWNNVSSDIVQRDADFYALFLIKCNDVSSDTVRHDTVFYALCLIKWSNVDSDIESQLTSPNCRKKRFLHFLWENNLSTFYGKNGSKWLKIRSVEICEFCKANKNWLFYSFWGITGSWTVVRFWENPGLIWLKPWTIYEYLGLRSRKSRTVTWTIFKTRKKSVFSRFYFPFNMDTVFGKTWTSFMF